MACKTNDIYSIYFKATILAGTNLSILVVCCICQVLTYLFFSLYLQFVSCTLCKGGRILREGTKSARKKGSGGRTKFVVRQTQNASRFGPSGPIFTWTDFTVTPAIDRTDHEGLLLFQLLMKSTLTWSIEIPVEWKEYLSNVPKLGQIPFCSL